MNETEKFAKILKHGRCNSSTHGRCKDAAHRHKRTCPQSLIEFFGQRICQCCETCYGHCAEEAKQSAEDFENSYKEWSSWKNRTKRNIKEKITKWCGST